MGVGGQDFRAPRMVKTRDTNLVGYSRSGGVGLGREVESIWVAEVNEGCSRKRSNPICGKCSND